MKRPVRTPDPDRAGLPAVFSYSKARAAGISSDRLRSYCDQGIVEQIGRGLYRWSDSPESDINLLEIAHRASRPTLCLISALARHGLTDIIPPQIDVAIPRGERIPILQSPVRFHVFASKSFDLGREEVDVGDDVSIGLYSAERSIIDMIRLRHNEGSDIAWEALRRWLRRRGSKPATLLKMATHFHGAERAVRSALEVVM
jgi:predicted transcriptional regulator of viral defense system